MSARSFVELEHRLLFAMGGGGFTMEPTNPLLDDYVLGLAKTAEPRILFLPTASGDTTAQINAFRARFAGRHCIPQQLSLFRLQDAKVSLAETVHEQDIIYVGGGSMRNMLAIWHAHGLAELLLDAWRRGTVLAGLSAGAMCWFEGGVTRSSGPPEPIAGLGLLEGSLTVHADGEPERMPAWLAALREGRLLAGSRSMTRRDAVSRQPDGARRQLTVGRRCATRRCDSRRAGPRSRRGGAVGNRARPTRRGGRCR